MSRSAASRRRRRSTVRRTSVAATTVAAAAAVLLALSPVAAPALSTTSTTSTTADSGHATEDRPAATAAAPAAATDPPDDNDDHATTPSETDPTPGSTDGSPEQQPDSTGEPSEDTTGEPPPEQPSEEATECTVSDGDKAQPATSWAQKRLQFDRIGRISRGKGVTIAMIDSGISVRNPHLWESPTLHDEFSEATPDDLSTSFDTEYSQDLLGDGNEWYDDCDGHGTAIAGILAAKPIPGYTVEGIAQRANLLTYRYVHSPPEQGEDDTDPRVGNQVIAQAVDQAIADGADIINISSASPSRKYLRESIQRAIDNDILVVAAAGNLGNDSNPVMYPAALPGVMAVGSVNKQGQRSEFSESSSPLSVSAPGEGLVLLSTSGAGYHTSADQTSGTSFAAPYVAGTAALVMSEYPDLSAKEVTRRIELTADPVGQSSLKTMGHGIVNPYEALTTLLPADADTPREPYAGGGSVPGFEPPPEPDTSGQQIALGVAGGAVGLAALIGLGVITVRRGRTRGWRADRRTSPSTDAEAG